MRRPVIILFGLLATAAIGAPELDDIELRGKQVFLHGTSTAGTPVTALLGRDQIEIPASAVPCASCHGIDGRGRPEGGIIPSDITWSELSKSYGHEHAYDRRHPAFDDASLATSITGGTDPAGNELDVAMPRYHMAQQDLDALIAYLKRLEYEIDPGVNEDTVQLATLLPLSGPAAPQGEAARAVLAAYVQQINAGGGVNGRAINLDIIPLGSTPEETVANVEKALESADVFALIAIYSQGVEADLEKLIDQYNVPVVGPVTRTPLPELRHSANIFYLYGGTVELVSALERFASANNAEEDQRRVIVGPDNALLQAAAKKIARDDSATVLLPYAAATLAAATAAAQILDTDDVFFLGTAAELERLIAALAARNTAPRLLLPAELATPALLRAPVAFDGRIYVAYPTLPADVNDAGRKVFAALGNYGELPSTHVSSQIAALAAARVLVEAMQRSGHALNRERLIAELEGMHRFATGLTPPISFSLNRRVGALGAHIVRLDLDAGRLVPATAWQSLD